MTAITENAAQLARVLIVDDERQNRQLLEIMLTPEKLLLQTAGSGEEALALVAEQAPDLIVLDVMMPGMDGYQVVASIKGNVATSNIPIVLVTALDDRNARLRGLGAGAEDFLTKPVDRVELCVRVRNLLRRKLAEEALGQVRDEQLRFKDEFLSHVSHELRSPLTAIKQFTSILLRGLAGELNEEQRQYQQIVMKNAGQLQAMIDDLLEITRLEAGRFTIEPERTSVLQAVTDSLDTLQGAAGAKEIAPTHDMAIDLPPVFADPTRLRQVLIILLDNAIKFTPAGGSVSVRACLLPDDPDMLLLEVSDTGCGISPDVAERVFERLYQESAGVESSRKGLGLGLFICKELVTRQGGEIRVVSRPGPGTTIAVTLPVFSLSTLLAPLLKGDKWPMDSVALVMVETQSLGRAQSRASQREWSREARTLLQHCLLPDLDVLLPNVSHGADGERFFVAAFADDVGAAVLVNRIGSQLARRHRAIGDGLSSTVSSRMLYPGLIAPGSRPESIVANVARLLEAAVTDSHTFHGGFK